MNSLKLITISVTVILTFCLLMLSIFLLTKNFKSKLNSEGKLKISFGLWYAALFLAGTSIISGIVSAAFEVVDNLSKINTTNFNVQLIKSVSLVVGVSFIWYFLWYFIIKITAKIISFNTDEHQEMEDDNFSYFTIKSVMFVGIIFSLSSLLTLILRVLIPNIEIPFYH